MNEIKKIEILFYLSKFIESIEELNEKDLHEISRQRIVKNLDIDTVKKINNLLNVKNKDSINDDIQQYYYKNFFNKLRNIVSQKNLNINDMSQLEWIIKVLLDSSNMFENKFELVNFLSNITGIDYEGNESNTNKIMEWYFKQVNNMSLENKNKVFYQILYFSMSNSNSYYKEWRNILNKEG